MFCPTSDLHNKRIVELTIVEHPNVPPRTFMTYRIVFASHDLIRLISNLFAEFIFNIILQIIIIIDDRKENAEIRICRRNWFFKCP